MTYTKVPGNIFGVYTSKPLSHWEDSSGDLALTRCKSTVKAICVGLANSANYPDQWSDATRPYHPMQTALWKGQAFCFAVRWRCVCCSLAWFPKRPSPSFLSESLWLSVERAFKFKGLYFDFIYISSELFLFPYLRQRRAGQITSTLSLYHHVITNFAVWLLFRCASA